MAILYPISIYIIFLQEHSISYRFLSSFSAGWSYVFGGEIRFGNRDERTWQKHPDEYSQHKIVDPYLSSMSWTSCSWKKPSRWKNINTQVHIHKGSKETDSSTKVFSCDYCKSFRNTYFEKQLQTAASVHSVSKLEK